MIPPFRRNDSLPAGIHDATWTEFIAHFGFSVRRRALLIGLEAAAEELRQAGCQTLYIDGSFATNKQEPNDFDACWDTAGVDITRLDPVFLNFSHERSAQKLKFMGELFPTQMTEGGSGKTFLEFFQTDKQTGWSKGIVRLTLGDLP